MKLPGQIAVAESLVDAPVPGSETVCAKYQSCFTDRNRAADERRAAQDKIVLESYPVIQSFRVWV